MGNSIVGGNPATVVTSEAPSARSFGRIPSMIEFQQFLEAQAPRSASGSAIQLQDSNGNGKIDEPDVREFKGRTPSPGDVAQEIAKNVQERQANIVLLSHENTFPPDAYILPLATELRANGRPVVAVFDNYIELYVGLIRSLNKGDFDRPDGKETFISMFSRRTATYKYAHGDSEARPQEYTQTPALMYQLHKNGVVIGLVNTNASAVLKDHENNRDAFMADQISRLVNDFDADSDAIVLFRVPALRGQIKPSIEPSKKDLEQLKLNLTDVENPVGTRLAKEFGDKLISVLTMPVTADSVILEYQPDYSSYTNVVPIEPIQLKGIPDLPVRPDDSKPEPDKEPANPEPLPDTLEI